MFLMLFHSNHELHFQWRNIIAFCRCLNTISISVVVCYENIESSRLTLYLRKLHSKGLFSFFLLIFLLSVAAAAEFHRHREGIEGISRASCVYLCSTTCTWILNCSRSFSLAPSACWLVVVRKICRKFVIFSFHLSPHLLFILCLRISISYIARLFSLCHAECSWSCFLWLLNVTLSGCRKKNRST